MYSGYIILRANIKTVINEVITELTVIKEQIFWKIFWNFIRFYTRTSTVYGKYFFSFPNVALSITNNTSIRFLYSFVQFTGK